MGRLIDADALIKYIQEEVKQDRPDDFKIENIQRFIKDMPTAYDIEKVVAELEERSKEYNSGVRLHGKPEEMLTYEAIDIVRKGGGGMNQELELYKLCCTDDNEDSECMVEELGWISGTEFCVWVSYFYIQEFINSLQRIFGYVIFDDGGFDANMQVGGVCIDLCEAVGHCIDIEAVFSKEKYKH